MTSFELGPGVVVDRDSGEMYVMDPGGGVAALDVGSGEQVWGSREAAKPLTVAGDLLIGQAEPSPAGGGLDVVALDRRREGAPVSRSRVDLPPGVQAAVNQGVNRSFTARASAGDTDATVSWEFVERPLRGITSGPLEVLPGEEPVPGPPAGQAPRAGTDDPGAGDVVVTRGSVRLELADGTVTPAAPPPPGAFPQATPVLPSSAAPDLPSDEQLPGVAGPQFLSADGSHVLTSEQVADDSVWEKYRWSVFERSSGRLLGELRSHVRFAPFFVDGTRVVHLVEPHAHRVGDELVDEPVQVRATDLGTGQPLWSRPVRDVADREAPPP